MNKLSTAALVCVTLSLVGIGTHMYWGGEVVTTTSVSVSPTHKKEQMETIFIELVELVEEDKKAEARKVLAHFYRRDLADVFTLTQVKWPLESMQLEYQVGQVLYALSRREKKDVHIEQLAGLKENLHQMLSRLPEPRPTEQDIAHHQPPAQ